jgi:hypothetical protein
MQPNHRAKRELRYTAFAHHIVTQIKQYPEWDAGDLA